MDVSQRKADAVRYSIKQLAQFAGTTSRTLRHYEELGLLKPTRSGSTHVRMYDTEQVLVLQRILLLRRLGMPLSTIGAVLKEPHPDYVQELTAHLEALTEERNRLDQLAHTVSQTISSLMNGDTMDASEALKGFNSKYRQEVTSRWGERAYEESSTWFDELGSAAQNQFVHDVAELNRAWIDAWEAGASPSDDTAQDLAVRHVTWLESIPGTPAHAKNLAATLAYVEGLAHMYPADPRFAAQYGGEQGALFVRDSLLHYVQTHRVG